MGLIFTYNNLSVMLFSLCNCCAKNILSYIPCKEFYMTNYTISDKSVLSQKVDSYAFLVHEGALKEVEKEIEKSLYPHLSEFLKEKKFTGEKGQTCTVVCMVGKKVVHLFFVGLGKKSEKHKALESFRSACALVVRLCQSNKILSIAYALPAAKDLGISEEKMGEVFVSLSEMAHYKFDLYLTKKEDKTVILKEIIGVVDSADVKAVKAGVVEGEQIAQAVNRVRLWVDLPANVMSPHEFSKRTKQLGKEFGLEVTVFEEDEIAEMGMGGLKAVGMGSQHDSHLVIMKYTCKKKNAPTIALVGKGITFDSGGLNIKPTGYMETMKEDMSGAAAVINALTVIAQRKPDVNVVAVAALAENMVSGASNHPGDIITFYNGKTAVVGNTDAEGRLVLADALAYADKNFKPVAMIDVATLTGACSHAVGPFFSGMLTQDEHLAKKIEAAAYSSGDAVWRLPLIDEYKVMVKSDLADLCNDGKTKYYAGATNGACFLSNFVGETPWVHLDIAPSAFDVPDKPYFRPNSATGVATRLLVDFVMNWK